MTRPTPERIEEIRERYPEHQRETWTMTRFDGGLAILDLLAEIDALRAEHLKVAEAVREEAGGVAYHGPFCVDEGCESMCSKSAVLNLDLAPIVERVTGRRP